MRLILLCLFGLTITAQAEIHWTTISNENPKHIQELDIENDGITDLTLAINRLPEFAASNLTVKQKRIFIS